MNLSEKQVNLLRPSYNFVHLICALKPLLDKHSDKKAVIDLVCCQLLSNKNGTRAWDSVTNDGIHGDEQHNHVVQT